MHQPPDHPPNPIEKLKGFLALRTVDRACRSQNPKVNLDLLGRTVSDTTRHPPPFVARMWNLTTPKMSVDSTNAGNKKTPAGWRVFDLQFEKRPQAPAPNW